MKFSISDKKKKTYRAKLLTGCCMFLIIASLYITCYVLFFRTVEVDVTKDANLQFVGESNSASVKVSNEYKTYNQRIQEFMDSITYKATPNTNLANGDVISIIASYDEELAQQYHIQPIETTKQIIVENLPERIQNIDEISNDFLNQLQELGENYLKKNMNSILQEDFTQFSLHASPKLIEQTKKYMVFLSAKSNAHKDKIIEIYEIKAEGMENTSKSEEHLELKENTIYYMITYNEINTSLQLREENIYGEKMIWSKQLTKKTEINAYLNQRYKDQYNITYIKNK